MIPVRDTKPPAARARTPAPPAEARPALSERLARRLASAAPAESRPAEIASPQIASLPPAEPAAAAPAPDRAVPGTPADDAGGRSCLSGTSPTPGTSRCSRRTSSPAGRPRASFSRSGRPPAALVSFRIDRAGRIGGIALKESSGSARFDKSALAAVQGLGQVSRASRTIREESLDVVIRFQNQK